MLLNTLLSFAILTAAKPAPYVSQPFSGFVQTRQAYGSTPDNTSSLEVDLGYATYRGYYNSTSKLNVFKGIRFAKAPVGELRWQAPQAPTFNRSETIPATEYAAQCPQNPPANYVEGPANNTGASEDCLFLNVWAPASVTKSPLPVFFYIHGGGYGTGNGQMDLQPIINTNENSFIAITIQYRLGAFGFLSSDEVYRKGVVNAGILDQTFALQWVQQYIHLFNGDPRQVTIGGESAGGGSVMLQDMAYGGSLGSQLFHNSIAASPFLPMQYDYKDWIPSQAYYSLAAQVGCDTMKPYGANGTMPTFECLLKVSSAALINASATISQSGTYGTWAFLPVTDGVFIQDVPSRQLARRAVNGVNALVGNNANEGYYFTTQTIETEEDLLTWLRNSFPLFSNNDIAKLLYYYPSTNSSVDPLAPDFATSGNHGPTALNQSSVGTGQQQRANNIYAETTFVCPSYWLAEAFSDNRHGGQSYKYQFSIPPALHGDEIKAWALWPGTAPFTYDFALAFQQIYGNFITTSNPSISAQVANGSPINNGTSNIATDWPPYSLYQPYQVNLNTTCGSSNLNYTVTTTACAEGSTPQNRFSLVDAYTWEGGRGVRCDWWRSVAELVPE